MKKIISIICIISLVLTPFIQAQEKEKPKRNLLENGSFEKGSLSPWLIFATDDYKKPTHEIKSRQINIKMQDTSVESYEIAIKQDLKLKSKTQYVIEFEAQTDNNSPQEVIVVIGRSVKFSKGHYGLRKKINIPNQWKKFKFNFTTIEIDKKDPPVLKFNIGKVSFETTISLKNVILSEI